MNVKRKTLYLLICIHCTIYQIVFRHVNHPIHLVVVQREQIETT